MSDLDSHSPAGHGHNDHANLRKSVRLYLIIGAILFTCTFITIAVAYLPLFDFGDKHLNIAFGLIIASFKVSLVGLIFMHLKHERGMVYKTLFFAMIFFAGMMFLFILAYKDPIVHFFGNQP